MALRMAPFGVDSARTTRQKLSTRGMRRRVSGTARRGAESMTMTSNSSLSSAKNCKITWESRSSPGLGALTPEKMQERFSWPVSSVRASCQFTFPARTSVDPALSSLRLSPKAFCTAGLRKSRSTRTVFFPWLAEAMAKLVDIKVLPSPGTALLKRVILRFFSSPSKVMEARRMRNISV